MADEEVINGVLQVAYAASLLKTGQTTSYHAGDDGDLEKGIAKDYTVLTTGQYSGTTNIVINAHTDALSNECVQDNNTGLMWARYVMDACGPANDGNLFWDEYTVTDTDISFDNATSKIHRAGGDWATSALCVGRRFTIAGSTSNDGTYNVTAVDVNDITVTEALVNEAAGASITVTSVDDLIWDAVDQANANSLGGHDDWRIPNRYELASIIDFGVHGPCIDTTVFPSTPAGYFWTSTWHANSSLYTFWIQFDYGHTPVSEKMKSKGYVRLVRAGT